MPPENSSWSASMVDLARKSKRAALSIALLGIGVSLGGLAKSFEKPFDSYASWLCLGVAALGVVGLVWVFVRTFRSHTD